MNNTLQHPVRSFACAVSALAVAACTTNEAPPLNPGDVPAAWEGPVFPEADVWPNIDWWNNFKDAELTAFLEEVKASNFDLANNRRNLESAQITLRDAGLARWPTPTVSLSDNSSFSANRNNGTTVSSGNNSNPTQLSFSASFSGVLTKPATYARALSDYESRLAQAADAAITTFGTATSAFFQVLIIRDRIVASRQNVENAETIGRFAEAQLRAGQSVPIDYLQQQIQIEQQRNSLRSLLQQERSALASLGLLVGRHLQGFDIEGQTLQNVVVPKVQPGLPSELLVRRPDLVQAEASLRSTTAQLNIVRKALLPQISLTGNANSSSRSLAELLSTPASNTFSLTANLAQTLLDNGARVRNIRSAEISLENALNNYRRTVLTAFNEIEIALYNIQLLEAQATVAETSLEAAEESYRIAELRYELGATNYQTVLQAQNTLFNSRNSFLDNKLQRLNAVLNFYQALGGGWDPDNLEIYGFEQPRPVP